MRPVTLENLDRFREFVMKRSAEHSQLTLGDLWHCQFDETSAEIRKELGWPAKGMKDQDK